jgi:hypothetical protein
MLGNKQAFLCHNFVYRIVTSLEASKFDGINKVFKEAKGIP